MRRELCLNFEVSIFIVDSLTRDTLEYLSTSLRPVRAVSSLLERLLSSADVRGIASHVVALCML